MFEEEFGIELEKYFKFNSSHFVIYNNSHETLHGHNYKVSMKIKSKKLSNEFMVYDFDCIKVFGNEICNDLKHCLLLPKNNTNIKLEEDGENNIKIIFQDGSFHSVNKKSIKIIDTEQISAECLSKYVADKIINKLKETQDFNNLEITKFVCKVYEDKGKCGIYSLKKKI